MTDEMKRQLELRLPVPDDGQVEAALRSITRQARRQRRALAAAGIAAATTAVLGAVALLDRDHGPDLATDPAGDARGEAPPTADCGTVAPPASTSTSTTLATPGGPLFPAWELREHLRTTVGDVVGGVYGEGTTNTLVIGILPGGRSAVEAAMRDFDATTSVPSPPLRFVEVANSLERLETLNARALTAGDELGATGGPDITSLGIDDASNTLAVGLQENTPANRAAVLEAICATPSEVSFSQEDPVSAL